MSPPATPTEGLAPEGLGVFMTYGCNGCHTVEGVSQGVVGPNLSHLASRTTIAAALMDRSNENLAAWLRDPPALKPGSLMPDLGLTKPQIAALVAYLQNLK